MRKSTFAISTLAILVFVAPVAHAQSSGGDWASVVAAAKKEGKVVLYTATSPQEASRLVAGFKKAYPDIAVESVRLNTSTAMTRLDQERTTGADGGDVWLGAELAWYVDRAKEGKLLKPIGPALKGWPAEAIVSASIVIPSRDPIVMLYNKQLVANPPKTYRDLLKPEFKGKVGTIEPSSVVQIAWYRWLEKTQGDDFLSKLKEQGPKIYATGPQLAQAVSAGEIAVSPGAATIGVVKPLMDSGAPIDYVLPNPAFAFDYYLAAFAWAKRPNAALVLVDYLMSLDGQAVWHSTRENAGPRTDSAGLVPFSALTPLDPNAFTPASVNQHRNALNAILK